MSDLDSYRRYFERANQGFAITSPDTRWLHVNTALCDMLGYTETELRRRNWVELTHPEDRAADLQQFQRLLDGEIDGYQLDKRFLRKDGTAFHARLTVAAYRDDDDQLLQVNATLLDRTEEQAAIDALKLSEERFRLLAESTLDGIWDWDLEANTLWLSPSWKAQLGYREDELANSFQTWDNLLHPDDHPQVMAHLRAFLDDPAAVWQETFRLRHATGHWRQIMARAIALLDEQQAVRRIVGVHVDITSEREAVAQLQAWSRDLERVLKTRTRELAESEARYRNIADHTFDWETWVDADGVLRYCSPACERISGHEPHAFLDDPGLLRRILHPQDREAWDRYNARLLKGDAKTALDASLTYRILDQNGEVHWLERVDHPMRADDGSAIGLRASIRDVTETRQALRELERQKSFVEAILGTAQALILVLSPKAEVVRINPFVETILGWRPEELIGRNWIDTCIPSAERAAMHRLFSRAFQHERTTGTINTILTKSGEPRQLRWYDELLADEHDGIPLLVAVGTDVTDQLAAEEALRQMNDQLEQKVAERTRELTLANEAMVQSEKLSSLGTLVAGLAHEINNPLMGLGNYVQFARRRSEGRTREILEKAEREIGRIGDILHNLLNYARPAAASETSAVDLLAVARRATDLVAADLRRRRIELQCQLPTRLPAVKAEEAALQQVLLNLLINARDVLSQDAQAAPTARWIRLEAGASPEEAATPDATPKRVWISLSDNGSGVPAPIRARIFDPFFTTKPRGSGTGLGLSVSAGIIRGFGGSLTLQRSAPTGATFRIELPTAPGTSDA